MSGTITTCLPVELQEHILTYVRNPAQTSLVCRLWHQISSSEYLYDSILSTLESCMDQDKYKQILREFDVQPSDPASTNVKKIFQGVHQSLLELPEGCKMLSRQHLPNPVELLQLESNCKREHQQKRLVDVLGPSDYFSPLRVQQVLVLRKKAELKAISWKKDGKAFFFFLTQLPGYDMQRKFQEQHKEELDGLRTRKRCLTWLRTGDSWKEAEHISLNASTWRKVPWLFVRVIPKCAHLKQLYLAACEFGNLPEQVFQCGQLKHLDIASNELKELPDGIGKLMQLEKLVASLNHISTLPPGIKHLKELQYLDLTFNPLKRVPKEILTLPKLEYISILSFKSWKKSSGIRLEDFLVENGIELYEEASSEAEGILSITRFCRQFSMTLFGASSKSYGASGLL